MARPNKSSILKTRRPSKLGQSSSRASRKSLFVESATTSPSGSEILTQSDKSSMSQSRSRSRSRSASIGRSRLRSRSRSHKKLKPSKTIKPASQFIRINDPQILNEVRRFTESYARDDEFEAFTLVVDKIPFVAISLMNADQPLRGRFFKMPPPTPMKPRSKLSDVDSATSLESLTASTKSPVSTGVRFNENLERHRDSSVDSQPSSSSNRDKKSGRRYRAAKKKRMA